MKLGKIKLTSEIYEMIGKDKFYTEIIKKLFCKITPLAIKDERIIERCVWYYCYWDEWKDVKEGEAVPEYDVTIHGKEITISR